MKKLLSMVLALCMLVNSSSLAAAADTEALTTFKSTKLMALDKNAISTGNLTVDKDGKILANWAQGTLSIATETNLSGVKFKSVKIENTTPWFAGIGSGETAFKEQILNKPKTTYELWVKVSDIGLNYNERKNIFYTGSGMNYSTQYEIGHGNQSLFVRNGKLVYEIVENKEAKVVGEYDLTGKASQYIHAVLTREVNSTDSNIVYSAYFDGVKAGDYVKTIGVDTGNPDGNLFFFGGFWDTTDTKWLWKEEQRLFSGNVAEFNIYSDIATAENITALYNENKDMYTRPMTVETFRESKVLEIDPTATSTGNLLVDPSTKKVLSSWFSGKFTNVTETNISGATFNSVNFSNQDNTFFEGDGNATGKQDLWQLGINKDEMTYEVWLKTDDIGNGTNKKPIFYTGTHFHFHTAYSSQVRQSLYICGDELVYCDNDDTNPIGTLNLDNYKSQYVHAVMTRTKNTENSSVTYSVYFNGKLAGTKTKTVDNLDTVDGSLILLTGVYHDNGDVRGPEDRFDGNIAQFNIYHRAASEDIAKGLYETNKDTYTFEVIQEPIPSIEAFKKAKKIELNKNASSVGALPVAPGTTSSYSNWPSGSLNIEEETNVSGETFKSVNISNDTDWFIGADNASSQSFFNQTINNPKTTWEFWLKTDDIDRGNKWRKNIFYAGTDYTYHAYFTRNIRHSLYIQDGKLIYGTNDKEVAVMDLGNYQSKYIHAIIARETDETNGTIRYVAYFNGRKAGEYVKNAASDMLSTPDGNKVFFGGVYKHVSTITPEQRFNGNIAEFNVYHDIVTDEIAETLYEENKDTYKLYAQFLNYYPISGLTDNTITFNFDSLMDESTFADGIILKKGGTTLIYGTDYTAKAVGMNIIITIQNLDDSANYTAELTNSLKAADGTEVNFDTDEEYVFEFTSLNKTINNVKTQLAEISDFSETNVKALKALKEKIMPLENLGVDFSGAANYDSYCNIKENITGIKSAASSYSDDKLYINLAFEYPVSESYIKKIKYFEGRKEAEFDIQSVKNSANEIIGAKITADNMYKDADYVQVTADEGWIGQETKNFNVPTAVTVKNITVKDSQNEQKSSLLEITDGKANVSVTAINNAYENGVSGDFIISVKDEKGILKDLKIVPAIMEKDVEKEIPATFESIPANAKNYSVEAYFWSGTSSIKPYTEKTDYTKTYGIDNVNDTTKDITVVAIGGSITEGGNITTPFIKSWDDSREGKINFINAGIGGTQSNYGSLRLQNDVLSHKPDVVIVEFILNDTGDETCAWNVENIIRTCYEAEHQPVVMFLYVPDRIMSGTTYRQVENYNRYKVVLDAYGLTPLNAHGLAVANVENGTNWDEYVYSTNVHPNETQGANIAALMWNELSNNMSEYMKNITYTDKIYHRDDIKNGTRVSSAMTTYDENWEEKTPDDLVTEGYGNAAAMRSDKYIATKKAGAKLSFEFSGTKLILTTIVGKTGRSAEYVIKDKNGNIETQGTISNYVNLTPFENLMFDLNATSGDQYMELNLTNGMHTLEITVSDSDNADSEFGIADILIDEPTKRLKMRCALTAHDVFYAQSLALSRKGEYC